MAASCLLDENADDTRQTPMPPRVVQMATARGRDQPALATGHRRRGLTGSRLGDICNQLGAALRRP